MAAWYIYEEKYLYVHYTDARTLHDADFNTEHYTSLQYIKQI